MRMRTAWQITALFFLVLSAFVIFFALNFYAYKDRLGPGPAFFPVWVSILNILLVLLLLFHTVKGREGLDASVKLIMAEGPMLRRSLICFLGLLVCAVLLEPLGFILTIFLFLVLVPFGLGQRSWWRLLVFGFIGSIGLFYGLNKLLFVPLPPGILSF